MSEQYSAVDLYLDKSVNLLELAWMTQDEIANQIIEDMVRDGVGEQDASEAEIMEAVDMAAAEIYREVQEAVEGDRELPWDRRRRFTATEVREAAQQALDNWDWDAVDNAPAMQAKLAGIRDGHTADLLLDRAFNNIWDWLDEGAR